MNIKRKNLLTGTDCWCYYDGRYHPDDEVSNMANPKEIQIKGATYRLVESPPEPKFKVGDFVQVSGSTHNITLRRLFGKVIDVGPLGCEIEFAQPLTGLHSAGGLTKWGHGWYCSFAELEVVD